jgi:hypothetical protein
LGTLILMVSIPELHLGLDQLEDEATAYFPPVARQHWSHLFF